MRTQLLDDTGTYLACWQDMLSGLQDAFVLANDQLNIINWNQPAAQLFNATGIAPAGNNLLEWLQLFFNDTISLKQKLSRLQSTGHFGDSLLFSRPDGKRWQLTCMQYHFPGITGSYITASITPAGHISTPAPELPAELFFYRLLADQFPSGILLLQGTEGKILFANAQAAQWLQLHPGATMQEVQVPFIGPDGEPLPDKENPLLQALQTAQPVKEGVIGIRTGTDTVRWLFLQTTFVGEKTAPSPTAIMMIALTDCTQVVQRPETVTCSGNRTQELAALAEFQKNNARYAYIAKVISDSMWDWNVEAGTVYRNESFLQLTGYRSKEVIDNVDWWYSNIHPDDRERVKKDVAGCLEQQHTHWKSEYRFRCANGQYLYLADNGYFIYNLGKPVRAIGAIQDITEKKKLEEELLAQKARELKQINQAMILAQDHERNEISRELHDNINQMLSSASVLLSSVEGLEPDEQSVYIQKSHEYIGLAINEIRKISKSLNAAVISEVGLREPVEDIINQLHSGSVLKVSFTFDDRLEDELLLVQKQFIYRIIQEQVGNIIKHAKATQVTIKLQKNDYWLFMTISDNGKGFDPQQVKNGIGFTNIQSRVEAFHGQWAIESSPGQGCLVDIRVPLMPTE